MTDVALHAPFAGWLRMLAEVPDPVFADGMMGDGLAIDPLGGVLRAPADGEVVAVATTAHAVTLRLANGVDLLLHVGLETVALGGRGFRADVSVGDRVSTGRSLLRFDLDAVARGASDMVTPIVSPTDGATVTVDRPGRLVAAGERVATIAAGEGGVARQGGPGHRRTIVVDAPHGLHARPAARIVARLKPFSADVTLAHDGRSADARSTVALLTLGAGHGATLDAVAAGPDAIAALDALAAFAAERFGDDLSDAPAAVSRSGPVCAAPGLAIGRIRQLRMARIEVPADGAGVDVERRALDGALRDVAGALATGDGVLEAHRAIVEDPGLRASALAAIDEGRSAGHAWRGAVTTAAEALLALDDPRLAERVADLHDVEARVLAAITGTAPSLPKLDRSTVLIAPDLLPSQFLALDRTRLAGICTAAGGPTAHVAIMAAAAGVPMVVAAGPDVLSLADGTPAILDADAARLVVDPPSSVLDGVAATIATRRQARADAVALAQAPCRTADGARIEVFANLGSVQDAAAAVAAGAEGCGLLRTEFLFLDRRAAPSQEEQRALYAAVATTLGDRPLVIRTLDIGGDKPVAYLPAASEENPALGLRGVRLSLARPDMLATQLRAILAGVPGRQCRIMLPMVIDGREVAAVRRAMAEAASAVGRTDPAELGVMIETPAAAMLADRLAGMVDFLSIGTNDLTQYALAADRTNAAVAELVDPLHPAVLRLIAQTTAGAATHGRWVGVCGTLASDPRAAPLLVGLGVTELSAVPSSVPDVKAAVRSVTLADARDLAARACAAASAADVRALLGDRT